MSRAPRLFLGAGRFYVPERRFPDGKRRFFVRYLPR